MSHSSRFKSPYRAFTLLEVLVVILVLGILAGLLVVTMQNNEDDTRQAAFIASLKILSTQGYVYYVREGMPLEDSSSGSLPSGFDQYVSQHEFESPTPIGGVWDAEDEGDFPGVVSAIGVHFNGGDVKDDAYMTEIDQAMDDGNLATGSFRKLANDRFYYLIIAQ